MGRPRSRNKDLPRGLYKDAAGRFYLKAFDEEGRRRLGGKSSVACGRDAEAARKRWAEIFGFRDHEPPAAGTIAELLERFEEDELPRVVHVRGEPRPKYAPRTQREYKRIVKKLRAAHGDRKYARSEAEAARGGFFRTMDVSQHLRGAEDAGKGPQGNRDAAVLGSVFRFAKECGLTEYNPCRGAQRNPEVPREQLPDDQLFLDLYAAASPVLRCLMDLATMIGSRAGDLLRIMEADWTAAGLMVVPAKVKRGQARRKQLFERTDELAEVLARAAALKRRTMIRDRDLPGYKKIASPYMFVSGPSGQPYSSGGFQAMVRRAKARVARARLKAQGIETPDVCQMAYTVRALDVHFHDLRARAITDAWRAGQDGADFGGHATQATTRRVYRRGVVQLRPNPKIKGA
ncbi:MAG: hypothetical protein IPP91_11055 [Betaproteobacteria bacterium]|nr:hypothetical protein [Betaproteobacteria bacterium]